MQGIHDEIIDTDGAFSLPDLFTDFDKFPLQLQTDIKNKHLRGTLYLVLYEDTEKEKITDVQATVKKWQTENPHNNNININDMKPRQALALIRKNYPEFEEVIIEQPKPVYKYLTDSDEIAQKYSEIIQKTPGGGRKCRKSKNSKRSKRRKSVRRRRSHKYARFL